MNAALALGVVVLLVAAAAAVGSLWRRRSGRIRQVGPLRLTPADVGEPHGFGERGTLLQFSTEFCAPCRATRPLLRRLAASRDGVAHLEVDLTRRPELADRFGILQTPTTFLLDGAGRVRARVGGAPRVDDLSRTLDDLLEDTDARSA